MNQFQKEKVTVQNECLVHTKDVQIIGGKVVLMKSNGTKEEYSPTGS